MRGIFRGGTLVQIFLLAILLVGCAEKLKTYEHSGEKIKIKYPLGWEIQEGILGSVVIFNSDKEGENDRFQENLSVIVQDLGGQKITLEQYSAAVVNQIKHIIPSDQIMEAGTMTLSGNKGQKIVCRVAQGGFRLKLLQIWTIQGQKAYMITFTAEEDKYLKYQGVVQKMIKSFKIL